MVLLYMETFAINIPQMLAYIPYMDPMGTSLLTNTHINKIPRREHHLQIQSNVAN